jgi:ribonucleoside-triphosphate reductase
MSITALQEYTRFAKYAMYLPDLHRRETWQEQVDRVFNMHEEYLGPDILASIKDDFYFTKKMVLQKRVLGSQRALQFGGAPILKKHARMYNCTVSYCDRPRFFQEAMWLLLCGCGVGFSVQKHHIEKLPEIKPIDENNQVTYVIPDTIEGWADSIGVLMSSYFDSDNTPFPEYRGKKVNFDYSLIRPEGSPLSFGAKAPGPDKLKESLDSIAHLLYISAKHQTRLKPINAYDIVMYLSEAVLSGGIRRSATICIFSPDDNEMADAKIGSWRKEFKHRARSNNSALLIRSETSKEMFSALMKRVKEFGEPGFIWSENREALYNPCVEIGMYAKLDLNDDLREKFKDEIRIQNNDQQLSGWQFCNLCEINIKKATTKEKFLEACRAASTLGTIQAKYTNFEYLGEVSTLIAQKEALLGVSMTGMADCPEIALDPEIQREGAKLVLDTNEKIAKLIGVNLCARSACIKPAGTSSCVLGTASGIHPHHAKRYFRRVQANKIETPLQFFKQFNPAAVKPSVWASTDEIITFLCEVPDGAKTKNTVNAIDLLKVVKLTQQNWVEYGTRHDHMNRPWLRHNVSNTIHVQPDEWEAVEDFIYENRHWFAGVSLLPVSSDKDYPQTPFTAVFTPTELVRMHGDASVFASGIIERALDAFNDDLWAACDCVLDIGEILDANKLKEKITSDCKINGAKWRELGLSSETPIKLLKAWLKSEVKNYDSKIEWIRKANQFANRYFNGDKRQMTYCLKDVYNWKEWCDLKREYVEIDWSLCKEDSYGSLDFGQAGDACSGGSCELGELGATISEKKG